MHRVAKCGRHCGNFDTYLAVDIVVSTGAAPSGLMSKSLVKICDFCAFCGTFSCRRPKWKSTGLRTSYESFFHAPKIVGSVEDKLHYTLSAQSLLYRDRHTSIELVPGSSPQFFLSSSSYVRWLMPAFPGGP